MNDKASLRKTLREARRAHVAALPEPMRALVFHRPPASLVDAVEEGATIGLYRASAFEAPAQSYAAFFAERGHRIALPRFGSRGGPMEFAIHTDPLGDSDCEIGPHGILQPQAAAEAVVPDVLIVPLLGFTERGERLGQGGGHYDRWLAEHDKTQAIGLAWDIQKCADLPIEPHDALLDFVVTPTCLYGPFA